MSTVSRPWVAIQIKRNAFRQAETALLRQGLTVFCPKIGRTVRRYGKARPELAPLFPGYLFLAAEDPTPSWRAVANTPGVSRIVTWHTGEPAAVPRALIDGLRARCDESGMLLPPESVYPGESVRIVAGAFADLVATVERIEEGRRVWVLLDLLSARRAVEVDLAMLRIENAA